MKIAIMQPYIFPYVGYFHLVNAVDTFVFYDDVHFIKKGWINKNNLLVNGVAKSFTVPLQKVSQNKLICEVTVNADQKWLKQTLDTVYFNYKKAPFFEPVFEMIKTNFEMISEEPAISKMAEMSVRQVMEYLSIKKEFVRSSEAYAETRGEEKATRLQSITRLNNSTDYINAAGGAALYSKEDFLNAGIRLHFIHPQEIIYPQFNEKFVPWLSIIDVLMFNSIDEVKNILEQYKLV